MYEYDAGTDIIEHSRHLPPGNDKLRNLRAQTRRRRRRCGVVVGQHASIPSQKSSPRHSRPSIAKQPRNMSLPPPPTGKKPAFTAPPSQSDLLSRLTTFLPQLSAANATLDEEIRAHGADSRNIEHVADDEERYIEMNLGLGVLEEVRDESSSDEDSEDDEDEEEEEEDAVEEIKTIVAGSTRHGKGPREGKQPLIEEVMENKHTPTPETRG
ncbi:hypothetical protein BZA05DRAFT_370597 [Tricharina praecox]|uniref:uncharacterized protein n=1 Tax=Tricharina praecox TaxID=43433 RepID=UPI00222077F3|nr:uncharacterized protein BZA05DRAFT_370597 [Tricharina praecox]KAI5854597.1 hypothetical protein BZA05DRAFT_370597 [Tricharina praecox]